MIKTVPIALQRLAKTSATSINLFLGRVNTKDVAQLPTEFFKIDSGINNATPSTSTSSCTREHTNTETSSTVSDSGTEYTASKNGDENEMGSGIS